MIDFAKTQVGRDSGTRPNPDVLAFMDNNLAATIL